MASLHSQSSSSSQSSAAWGAQFSRRPRVAVRCGDHAKVTNLATEFGRVAKGSRVKLPSSRHLLVLSGGDRVTVHELPSLRAAGALILPAGIASLDHDEIATRDKSRLVGQAGWCPQMKGDLGHAVRAADARHGQL